jgi:hypothetical protein
MKAPAGANLDSNVQFVNTKAASWGATAERVMALVNSLTKKKNYANPGWARPPGVR